MGRRVVEVGLVLVAVAVGVGVLTPREVESLVPTEPRVYPGWWEGYGSRPGGSWLPPSVADRVPSHEERWTEFELARALMKVKLQLFEIRLERALRNAPRACPECSGRVTLDLDLPCRVRVPGAKGPPASLEIRCDGCDWERRLPISGASGRVPAPG